MPTTTKPIPELNASDKARFWKKVNKDGPVMPHMDTPCWVWLGAKTKEGYGTFQVRGQTLSSHRVAYIMSGSDLNEESPFALHRCDNRPCVRASHLFSGTHMVNCLDKEAKGRGNQPKGEENGNAKLAPGMVVSIIAHYMAGGITQRQLAAEHGIGKTQIGRIIRRERWAHL